MTLAEVLSNEELRRHEFPVASECIFLAHAGDCPLPRRVAEAVANYARQCASGDQEKFIYPMILNDGRKHAAHLLNCQPDEVAFVGPTSLALSLLASGASLRKGDNIVIYFDDYPSNVYPWMALTEKGVQVRMLQAGPKRGLGVIRLDDIAAQIDEHTRLVALASCHFISGYRIDFDSIGKFLRERNILFCLDAIQTLGAFTTKADNVDMLAADAHKWLLGPCGAGVMFVRSSVQPVLNPPLHGWNNVRCPNYVAQDQIVFRKGSQKYEVGTHNFLGLVGLVAAMELILEIGVDNIGQELLRKRAWLVPAIQAKGWSVQQADVPPQAASSIVSFYRPGQDPTALHQKLLDANIVTSLRADRSGQKYIRLSPHFYNTDEELQKLVENL